MLILFGTDVVNDQSPPNKLQAREWDRCKAAGTADGQVGLQGSANAADGPLSGLKQWRRRESNPAEAIPLTY